MEPVTHLGNIEEITIESDERGWELHFVSTDHGRFIANIHMVATDLLEQVRPIDHWLEEGRAAAHIHRLAVAYGEARLSIGDERLTDDGYDLSDPKHPDFHSVHSDIWDNREKGV